MDIFAHTLWANAAARTANKKLEKKGKSLRIHPLWTGFWGVFPDLFAFSIPFIISIYGIITGNISFDSLSHHGLPNGFDLAGTLYQYSHSLVIWTAVFIITWIISKRPRWELLGWLLHILIDIPSHSIEFFPTPFLFPISEYRFPYGISWANQWYMIINYLLLLVVFSYSLFKKKHIKEKIV